MKKLLLFTVLIAAAVTSAEARHRRHDEVVTSGRSRTIYVIENHHPVQRVVYVAPGGGYYQVVDGHRVYIRDHYYTSYPSRYYTRSGRQRPGVTINF